MIKGFEKFEEGMHWKRIGISPRVKSKKKQIYMWMKWQNSESESLIQSRDRNTDKKQAEMKMDWKTSNTIRRCQRNPYK